MFTQEQRSATSESPAVWVLGKLFLKRKRTGSSSKGCTKRLSARKSLSWLRQSSGEVRRIPNGICAIIPSRVLCAAATANAPLPGESSELRADISISVPTQHMTAIRIVRLVKDTARHGLRTLLTQRLGKCSHWLKRKLSKNTRSASAGNLPSQNARMQSVICRNSTNSSRQ